MKLQFSLFSLAVSILCLFALLASCEDDDEGGPDGEVVGNCIQPPKISYDYGKHIYPNCFSNIQRLGRWIGAVTPVTPKTSPAANFTAVSAGEIANTTKPIHLYVVTHGWAPTYATAVKNANYKIQWWGDSAKNSAGTWASSWFWTPSQAPNGGLMISETGLIQQLIAYENAQNPNDSVIVLAYSWIDNSATEDESYLSLTYPRISEAYTNMNALRLAQAIEEAVGPGFLDFSSQNTLHLIGHSHGSKVVTVAAMELQNDQKKVNHLTILDSPESGSGALFHHVLQVDAANLVGYYLSFMDIQKKRTSQVASQSFPMFVDNYISEFGVAVSGNRLDSVVNIGLYPDKLFSGESLEDRVSDDHAYSGMWYGGAAIGAKSTGNAPIGLAWPPVPDNTTGGWYQPWENKPDSAKYQWQLVKGNVSHVDFPTYTYGSDPIEITKVSSSGPVTSQSGMLVFDGTSGKAAVYAGKVDLDITGVYGVSFDMKWDNPAPGDYFVVTVDAEDFKEEVALVFDGKSVASGWHKVSFNTDLIGEDTRIHFHFLPAKPKSSDTVTIKDFRDILVGGI